MKYTIVWKTFLQNIFFVTIFKTPRRSLANLSTAHVRSCRRPAAKVIRLLTRSHVHLLPFNRPSRTSRINRVSGWRANTLRREFSFEDLCEISKKNKAEWPNGRFWDRRISDFVADEVSRGCAPRNIPVTSLAPLLIFQSKTFEIYFKSLLEKRKDEKIRQTSVLSATRPLLFVALLSLL